MSSLVYGTLCLLAAIMESGRLL